MWLGPLSVVRSLSSVVAFALLGPGQHFLLDFHRRRALVARHPAPHAVLGCGTQGKYTLSLR